MNKKYLLLGLLGVILVFLVLRSCDNKKKGDISNEHLQPRESTAIIVDTNTRTVTTITKGNSNGNGLWPSSLRGRNSQPSTVSPEIVKRTEGARDIRISIDNKGNATYTFRTWGIQFSPEVGVYYAASHTGVVVNDSFFFYKKHGALVGLRFALSGSREIRPYVGYTYNPEWKYLNNTSVVLGVDLDKQFVLATSTHF